VFEGLPGVLIQALAMGCPVVATDCPSGPAEILDGGRHGRLVPPGDPDALAAAILAALAEPPDRDAARRRAELFRLDRVLAQYREVMGV
jgi:glycosyltransferase involved in cell wall biosynthesis